MSININDIKIKIRFLNSKSILAQARVILFDVWEEKGWKILKSYKIHPDFQEKIWIQSPCYKQKNKDGEEEWKEIVFINDKRLYNLVQAKIYDAFYMARNKKEALKPNKKKSQNEKVNSDDIPL